MPREFTIKLEGINEASVEYRRLVNKKIQKTIVFTMDAKRFHELEVLLAAIKRDLTEDDEDEDG